MNKTPHSLLGFPAAWESEALDVLNHSEAIYGSRIEPEELRSLVLSRLHVLIAKRTVINDSNHLVALLKRIVRQVVLDHERRERRHYQRHLYVETFDFPAVETDLESELQDRWQELLGSGSPLNADEKLLLQTALEDPSAFIARRGINQSALAEHFGVNQTTVRNRWRNILGKVRAQEQAPDLPLGF